MLCGFYVVLGFAFLQLASAASLNAPANGNPSVLLVSASAVYQAASGIVTFTVNYDAVSEPIIRWDSDSQSGNEGSTTQDGSFSEGKGLTTLAFDRKKDKFNFIELFIRMENSFEYAGIQFIAPHLTKDFSVELHMPFFVTDPQSLITYQSGNTAEMTVTRPPMSFDAVTGVPNLQLDFWFVGHDADMTLTTSYWMAGTNLGVPAFDMTVTNTTANGSDTETLAVAIDMGKKDLEGVLTLSFAADFSAAPSNHYLNYALQHQLLLEGTPEVMAPNTVLVGVNDEGENIIKGNVVKVSTGMAMFPCTALGNPSPKLTMERVNVDEWIHNVQWPVAYITRGILDLGMATPAASSGPYRCRAVSGTAEASVTFDLQVYEKTTPTATPVK